MWHVNIYITGTACGPRKQDAHMGYMLEAVKKDGTPETRDGYLRLEGVTEMQAQLHTVLAALRRIKKECEISIYGAGWMKRAAEEGWVRKWKETGWLSAKGKPVCFRQEWLELEQISDHNFITFEDGFNSYKKVLDIEIRKNLNKPSN